MFLLHFSPTFPFTFSSNSPLHALVPHILVLTLLRFFISSLFLSPLIPFSSCSCLNIVACLRSQEENIGKWKLTRNVDGEEKLDYRFFDEYLIQPGQKFKVRSHPNVESHRLRLDQHACIYTYTYI